MSTLTAANSERQVRLVILNIQANDGEQNHAALQYNHQISPAFRLVVMYAKPEEISQRLSQLLTEHLQFRWLQLFKLRFLYPATDGACLPVIMPPNEHSKIIPLAEYLERYQPYHQCVRSVTLSPAENTTLITPFAEIMRDEEPKMMLVWFDSPDVAASATVADENEEPSSSAVAEMTGKKFLSYILLYQSNRLQLCQLNYSRTAQQLLCLPSNELLRPRMQRSFRQMVRRI
jgi:hypothetical protein